MSSIRILFIHGLEGHPNGSKVRMLRAQGFTVDAPNMHMSLWNIWRRNSVVRHLFRIREAYTVLALAIGGILAGLAFDASKLSLAGAAILGVWLVVRVHALLPVAIGHSFDACVAVQTKALQHQTPDIVIGSSWGGAVATQLIAHGAWTGPTILLAPALEKVSTWAKRDRLTRSLNARNTPAPVVIFHDPDDDVIPHQHSVRLAEIPNIELRSVNAGGHRLLQLLEESTLADCIKELNNSKIK